MKLEDLKMTWEQEIDMEHTFNNYNLIRMKVDKHDRQTRRMWAIELFACVGIIIFVSAVWLFLQSVTPLHPLFHLGLFSMIASAVFVAIKISGARKDSIEDNWTVHSKLDIQIEQREKEMKLLNNVVFWYLAPIAIAVFLTSYGSHVHSAGSYIPSGGLVLYWLFTVLICGGIFWMNRRHAKKNIRPLLDQLRALKRELEK